MQTKEEKLFFSGMKEVMTMGMTVHDTERCIPQKEKKMEPSSTPLTLAICTPHRAHMLVQQASEVVFRDSSSSLDRFNTSVFSVSTTSTASGVPLAVALTSDEKGETVYKAFETWKEVMPSDAFLAEGHTMDRKYL